MNFSYQALGYDANFEIALNMPLEQLRFYCVNNQLFKSICSDQEFWHERVNREYPNLLQYKPIDVTWGQYYLEAPLIYQLLIIPGIIITPNMNIYQVVQGLKNGTIKSIAVEYHDQIIGAVLMFPTEKNIDVFQRAFDLLISINPNPNPDTVFSAYARPEINIGVITIQNLLANQGHQRSVQGPVYSFWNRLSMIVIID